jgi:uncharacterized protein YbjT (DUF2867 family)
MSQILAVFGATGQQGSSVVNHVHQDPELSSKFSVRAITRDPKSLKSLQLPKAVKVVQGDMSDPASLNTALNGVHTIFAMTTPSFGPDALDAEFGIAKAIADAAVAQGVTYIIFSTLPSITEMTGGKCTSITPFDAKAKAEQYIRGLPIKSAFVALGSFMENFAAQLPFLGPRKSEDGTYVLARHVSAQTKWPLLNAVGDTGKFAGAILARPDDFEGKVLCAAERYYTLEEIISIMAKATGEKIVYKRVSKEEFKTGLAMLPPSLVEIFVEGLEFQEKDGYFGKDGEEKIRWAAEQVGGGLGGLEAYFVRNPLVLE